MFLGLPARVPLKSLLQRDLLFPIKFLLKHELRVWYFLDFGSGRLDKVILIQLILDGLNELLGDLVLDEVGGVCGMGPLFFLGVGVDDIKAVENGLDDGVLLDVGELVVGVSVVVADDWVGEPLVVLVHEIKLCININLFICIAANLALDGRATQSPTSDHSHQFSLYF